MESALNFVWKAPLAFQAWKYPNCLPSLALGVWRSLFMKDRSYLYLNKVTLLPARRTWGCGGVSFYFIFFLSLATSSGSDPADYFQNYLVALYGFLGDQIHWTKGSSTDLFFPWNNSFSILGFSWDGWRILPISFLEAFWFDCDLWGLPLTAGD